MIPLMTILEIMHVTLMMIVTHMRNIHKRIIVALEVDRTDEYLDYNLAVWKV